MKAIKVFLLVVVTIFFIISCDTSLNTTDDMENSRSRVTVGVKPTVVIAVTGYLAGPSGSDEDRYYYVTTVVSEIIRDIIQGPDDFNRIVYLGAYSSYTNVGEIQALIMQATSMLSHSYPGQPINLVLVGKSYGAVEVWCTMRDYYPIMKSMFAKKYLLLVDGHTEDGLGHGVNFTRYESMVSGHYRLSDVQDVDDGNWINAQIWATYHNWDPDIDSGEMIIDNRFQINAGSGSFGIDGSKINNYTKTLQQGSQVDIGYQVQNIYGGQVYGHMEITRHPQIVSMLHSQITAAIVR